MDSQTFIQKITDTIYEGCGKTRRYNLILKNVDTAVDNENISPIPYYYIGILTVVEEMGLNEYLADAMEEKIKKFSRELTINRLSFIVTDMFERNFDEDEDQDIINEFVKAFEDEFKNNFNYLELVTLPTTVIIQNIRNLVVEFTQNLDCFDFTSFDKELTENLYDCIDCEDDFEEIGNSEEGSDEDYQTESEGESEDESEDEVDDEIHQLLDRKIEEIRVLKERVGNLESQVLSMKCMNNKYSELLVMERASSNYISKKMFRLGFVSAFVFMLFPLIYSSTSFRLDEILTK